MKDHIVHMKDHATINQSIKHCLNHVKSAFYIVECNNKMLRWTCGKTREDRLRYEYGRSLRIAPIKKINGAPSEMV